MVYVTGITDAVNGAGFDRSMGYDDLDRLVSASGFWDSNLGQALIV